MTSVGDALNLNLNYPAETVISCKCKNCLTVRESFVCMSYTTWQSQNPDQCGT